MLEGLETKQFSELMAFWHICPWVMGHPIEKAHEESKPDSLSVFRQMAGV